VSQGFQRELYRECLARFSLCLEPQTITDPQIEEKYHESSNREANTVNATGQRLLHFDVQEGHSECADVSRVAHLMQRCTAFFPYHKHLRLKFNSLTSIHQLAWRVLSNPTEMFCER
jgi:hypothetical protein